MLALVYPKQTLIQQVSQHREANPLTLSYLANLVRTEPSNAELRALLIEQRVLAGELESARSELPELVRLGAAHYVPALELRILELEIARAPEDSSARRAAIERTTARLTEMSRSDLNTADLQLALRVADALVLIEVTDAIYRRLAASPAGPDAAWFADAARVELGRGHYRTAARLYFIAQARASAREEQRAHFLAGVAALQSGNLLAKALRAAAQHLGDLSGDEQALIALVNLARAANDPQAAEKYVRMLLHLSSATPLRRALEALLDCVVASAQATGDAADKPLRPFDERIYSLAWEVFVGNGKLDDAYRLAAAAVAQAPDNLRWRERLAQAAEWSGRPDVAAAQWRWLAEKSGAESAWQGVLRLAPGLADDEALAAAWRHAAASRELDETHWRQAVEVFERVGDPQTALALLDRAYARKPRLFLLERIADLEERSGRDREAVATHRRLIAAYGATAPRVLKLATLLLRQGAFAEALGELQKHASRVEARDAEYWRLLGDLAWRLQQEDAALRAYRKVEDQGALARDDAYRLVALLQGLDRVEAARIAQLAFSRFRATDLFLVALENYWEERNLPRLQSLFGALERGEAEALARNPRFLILRAQFRNAQGDRPGARADFERAAAIDADAALPALLWFLLDTQDLARLRSRMAALGPAAPSSELDAAQGAAWLTLGEPHKALPYFARQAEVKRDDPLWLMGYADALEAAGQPGAAWQLRRRVWLGLDRDHGATPALRQAQLRLALTMAPGDRPLHLLRRMLRQDAAAQRGDYRALDAATRELALAWALSQETDTAARWWLWRAYAGRLAAPAWAELVVALADGDRDTLNRLIDRGTLNPDAAREAAQAAGHRGLAETLAFEDLIRNPANDAAHTQFAELALADSSAASWRSSLFQRGVLQGVESVALADLAAAPGLRLGGEFTHQSQHSRDSALLTGVPGSDRQGALRINLASAWGTTDALLGRRQALADFTVARLTQRFATERQTLDATIAHNDRALETTPLSVGGIKDRLSLDFAWRIARRERLAFQTQAAHYHTQTGSYLGSGRTLNLELAHQLRTEYPDWTIRATGAWHSYNASGAVDSAAAVLAPGGGIPAAGFFLPASFRRIGVNAGFGTAYREQYTRAWRPFLDVGLGYNSVSGNGYQALAGIAGSVFGADHLVIYFTQAKGAGGTGDILKEFSLRYRYAF